MESKLNIRHALQRTRPSRSGCNRTPSRARIAELGTLNLYPLRLTLMPLLDLWTKSPEQLQDKQVQQLIAFAGAGRLLDGSPCSVEFRTFLASVPSANLSAYSDQCLLQSFQDSGLALQDIVNEVGARLGATVTPGRYRGTSKDTGLAGLWVFPSGLRLLASGRL